MTEQAAWLAHERFAIAGNDLGRSKLPLATLKGASMLRVSGI